MLELAYVGQCCGRLIDEVIIQFLLGYDFPSNLTLVINELTKSYTNLKSIILYCGEDEPEPSDITDQALLALTIAYPMLEHISIAYLTFTRQTAGILAKFTNLKSIKYSYCNSLIDEDITSLFCSMSNLTRFSIADSADISDAAIIAIAPYCTSLELLDISSYILTDLALYALAPHCSSLHVLVMSEMEHVTDAGISALIQGCPLLIELDINLSVESSIIRSPQCMLDICNSCPMLQCIRLPKYDYDVIAYLLQHGRSLRKIAWNGIGINPNKPPPIPNNPRLFKLLEHYNWNSYSSEGDPVCIKKHAYTMSAYTAWSDYDHWDKPMPGS